MLNASLQDEGGEGWEWVGDVRVRSENRQGCGEEVGLSLPHSNNWVALLAAGKPMTPGGKSGILGQSGNSGLPLPDCPAPSPHRSSKVFLLISHGSACKTVATVPNLKAIELPRPQEAVLG